LPQVKSALNGAEAIAIRVINHSFNHTTLSPTTADTIEFYGQNGCGPPIGQMGIPGMNRA
jgi:hypothetical protein